VAEDRSSILEAVLVIEAAAESGICAPVATRALIAPALTGQALPPVLGLLSDPGGALVRFGDTAGAFLALDGSQACVVRREQAQVDDRNVRWGYPVAFVRARDCQPLGRGSGAMLARLWRIALAAEGAALMRAAITHVSDYVRERKQFGRPIGSYQAVQHRLAESWVAAQAATWLARRAACLGDDTSAAEAACYAAGHMRTVLRSLHQVSGAMGITDEFGLTRYTAKLAYLHTELGGAASHARALATSRWFAGASKGEV